MSTVLLDRQSVRDRPGSVWDYISPSRLSSWLSCPLKFKFKYIDGMRTPTNNNLFLGKIVHGGLEFYYRRRQLGLPVAKADVAKWLLESWAKSIDEEDMTFDSTAEEQALQVQAVALVTAYLTYVPAAEAKPMAVETAVEAPLVDPATGEDLGMPLVGIMDLVLDEPAGPLIADFKTSARSAEPLEISHEIQLSSYAYLFRHGTQQREAGLEIRSLIKTKTPKVEFHRYPARTDAHFARLFAVVREYLDALDAGRFNFRPGFGCGFCDFRQQCSGWSG